MKKVLIFILIFFIGFLVRGEIVKCQNDPCDFQDFVNSLQNLIRTTVLVSYWVAVLMVSIGSFLIMFHGPRPDLYSKGVSLVTGAIIGFVLILLSGVIFDLILDFFKPTFRPASNFFFGFKFVSAQVEPKTIYGPLRNALMDSLKCGQEASSSLDKLFKCLFEVIELLKNIAVIFLGLAILVSAGYLIASPIFGFEKINTAKTILIWSTIGFIVVLVADVIKDQIQKIVSP